MRRRPLFLTATVLLLAACQDGSSAPATSPSAPSATTSEVPAAAAPGTVDAARPAPQVATELPDGVRRFGEGRARFATYDAATDRTVVATTIGLLVVEAAGAATLSPEMAVLLASSADAAATAMITSSGHLSIWDVATGRYVATFDVAPDRFSAVAFAGPDVIASSAAEVVRFSPDGTSATIATAPPDARFGDTVVDGAGTVAVPVDAAVPAVTTWTAAGGATTLDVGFAEGTRLTGVTWSSDGAHLAVLFAPPTEGDRVGVWDVGAGRFTGEIALPNLVLPAQIAFPTANRVVLPNLDRVVAYDLAGNEVAGFPAGTSPVSRVLAVAGTAVISTADGTLRRWTVTSDPTELGSRTVTLIDQRGGATTTVVDQVGLVRVFSADGAELQHDDRWAVGEATSVDLTTDGQTMAIATSTGAVRLLDPGDGSVRDVLDRAQGDVSDVSVGPDDGLVATGVSVQERAEAWDDTIEATDLTSGAQLFTLGGEAENVTGCSFYEGHVVFSPDGTLLASTSHDFTVQVTPIGDPDATKVLPAHLGSVLDVDFSPDGSELLTSADDGTLRVWDVDGWHLRDEYSTVAGGYFSMAFSPDGSVLAVSDVGGQISLVDPATGAVTRSFSGVRAQLGDMAFTPDGQRLLAPEPDGAVGVWSVSSGDVVQQLEGHTLPVTGLAIAHDGSAVATASQDGTVRYWPLPAA